MKDLFKILRLGTVILMVATLASCVTDSGYDLPKPLASQASDIPTDAKAVAAVIVERGKGSVKGKANALRAAGVFVAVRLDDILDGLPS